jgi:hypothetical protein
VPVVTILDECAVQWFRDNYVGPQKIPRDFDLNRLAAHDTSPVTIGPQSLLFPG